MENFINPDQIQKLGHKVDQNIFFLQEVGSYYTGWQGVLQNYKDISNDYMKNLLKLQNEVVSLKVPSLYSEHTEMYKRTMVGFLSSFVQRISEYISGIEELTESTTTVAEKISGFKTEFETFKQKEVKTYEVLMKKYSDSQREYFKCSTECDKLDKSIIALSLKTAAALTEAIISGSNSSKQSKQLVAKQTKSAKIKEKQKKLLSNYHQQHKVISANQIRFGGNFNEIKDRSDEAQLELFDLHCENLSSFFAKSSKFFKIDYFSEELEEFEKSTKTKKITLLKPLALQIAEKPLEHACYTYFTSILDLVDNELVNEIHLFSGYADDINLLNSMVVRLYERDIDVYNFLKKCSDIKGGFSVGIRYLYLMLLSCEDMKLCLSPARLAQFLSKQLKANILKLKKIKKEEKKLSQVDKQLNYYILKVGDQMYHLGPLRSSIDKTSSRKYTLIEKFKILNKNNKSYAKKADFWANYYRQNNYFYDNNKTLFSRVRSKDSKKGIELLLAQSQEMMEEMTEESKLAISGLLVDVVKGSGKKVALSKEGIRASSLNDIIRYMAYMKLELKDINKVCDQISTRYSMNKKLVYSVFQETQEVFYWMGYAKKESLEEDKRREPESRCLTTLTVGEALCKFKVEIGGWLGVGDLYELMLVNKICYASYSALFVKQELLREDISDERRVALWWTLMPERYKTKSMRSELEKDSELNIIPIDLKRSVKFFNRAHLQILHKILYNIAKDYPDLSYYQGMNYIAIFILKVFNFHPVKTYQFMSFIAENYLLTKFKGNLEKLPELIFLMDKSIQISDKKLWKRLKSANVSSIHYSVPWFITIFTTLQKSDRYLYLIKKIWDLFLVHGFFVLIKFQLQVLKLQKASLNVLNDFDLICSIKNLEKDLLEVANKAGITVRDDVLKAFFQKAVVLKSGPEFEEIEKLALGYSCVHKPIEDFWMEVNRKLLN